MQFKNKALVLFSSQSLPDSLRDEVGHPPFPRLCAVNSIDARPSTLILCDVVMAIARRPRTTIADEEEEQVRPSDYR